MKSGFLLTLLVMNLSLPAQTGYAVNDVTGDFPVGKIINYPQPFSSFQELKDRLVIVDFFGTWCVPCVRALPKLSALQEKYKSEIRILLVSNEPEVKLTDFLKKQTDFKLPVVVDEQDIFTKYFEPPSYPYTVIVGKNGKVIAMPGQEEMTEENINKWLIMQNSGTPAILNQSVKPAKPVVSSGNDKKNTEVELSKNRLVQLSQDFMYAAKTGDETSGFIEQLQQLSWQELLSAIKTDDEKKAFWINLYNAYTQAALKKDPEQYKNRGKFFGNKQINIAGHTFSLDDVEHGILRRSKIKWSLGYLNKLFPNKAEKALRVNKLDYRLHFALNCGAKSCPPIAFYKSEDINRQLDLAANAYLKGETVYNEASNTITLPTLMSWFRRDFGGKKKMITLLKTLSIVPADKHPEIKFKKYDWTLYLQNYK